MEEILAALGPSGALVVVIYLLLERRNNRKQGNPNYLESIDKNLEEIKKGQVQTNNLLHLLLGLGGHHGEEREDTAED